MSFTELFRMTNEKVDAAHEGASNSSIPPLRSESDFCELVWENGQIMFHGQSSKSKKAPPMATPNDYQSIFQNSQDGRDVSGLKINKFSTMDSILNEMGLEQDVDIVPWLNYSNEDPLHNDYTCDFLPELSGVTTNDISTDNHLAFREKKTGFHGVKHDVPRSGVSGITQHVSSQDITALSPCEFTNLRLQKLDAGQPSTSSSFTNFPYFSRSSSLAKVNYVNVNTSKRSEIDVQRRTATCSIPTDSTLVTFANACNRKEVGTHNKSVRDHLDEISGSLPRNPIEEVLLAKRAIREENEMNDTQKNHEFDAMKGKEGMSGEKNIEQVVAASSVCSGNSVDIAANERAYDLKRKSRETTESEGPSDEVEDESVGAKKAAHARASSKRSRAAEVHNLSERKRRDRINEKMRALQELIPNCNKVDKASMLDEAIEYLKTLQLQLQMMSMGAGMYMQPMMLPPGMQMPHFSPMGLGMGLGMGFGMNHPFQGPHYPVPGTPAQFHGIPGPSLQPHGHQGPSHQVQGVAPLNIPMGLNVSSVVGSSGASNVDPLGTAKDFAQQQTPNNSLNPATTQATPEGIQPSPSSHDTRQNVDASEFPQAE